MNILLISFVFSPNIGGVESHLDDLTKYLTEKGHHIVVLTYQPLMSNETTPFIENRENIEIRRLPWIKFLFTKLEKLPILEIIYLVPPILLYTLYYLLLHGKKIDVIQAHGFNMAIVGAIAGALFRKRLTVNTHVSFYFQKGSLYARSIKLFLNQAAKILVLTNEAKDELVKIGIDKKRLTIYHQWVDTNLFSSKNKRLARERCHLPQAAFIIFFAGRFILAKGISVLLRAARQFPKDVLLVFAGSGELRVFIEEEAKRNPAIRFVGQVDYKDLPYYYSASDLCIIPSIPVTSTYSEGIPRVLIESFTCGTPVIATKTGGIKELVNDRIGFFVSPKSESIATLINKLSHQQKKLLNMRKACVAYAKDQFGPAKNAAIIERSLLTYE